MRVVPPSLVRNALPRGGISGVNWYRNHAEWEWQTMQERGECPTLKVDGGGEALVHCRGCFTARACCLKETK